MKFTRSLPAALLVLAALLLADIGLRITHAQNDGKGTVKGLPADIYPDSFARAPYPKRADLKTDAERKAFDVVAGPDGLKPGPIPPNNLRLYFPIFAEHTRAAVADDFVDDAPGERISRDAGERVRAAALERDAQFAHGFFRALLRGNFR